MTIVCPGDLTKWDRILMPRSSFGFLCLSYLSRKCTEMCSVSSARWSSCDGEISDVATFQIPTLPNTVTLLHQCNSPLYCFYYFDYSTCQPVPGSVGEGTRCRPWRRPRQWQSTCKHKSITFLTWIWIVLEGLNWSMTISIDISFPCTRRRMFFTLSDRLVILVNLSPSPPYPCACTCPPNRWLWPRGYFLFFFRYYRKCTKSIVFVVKFSTCISLILWVWFHQ